MPSTPTRQDSDILGELNNYKRAYKIPNDRFEPVIQPSASKSTNASKDSLDQVDPNIHLIRQPKRASSVADSILKYVGIRSDRQRSSTTSYGVYVNRTASAMDFTDQRRKRSSTTTLSEHVFTNTSIFKPDPNAPKQFELITHTLSVSEDLMPEIAEPASLEIQKTAPITPEPEVDIRQRSITIQEPIRIAKTTSVTTLRNGRKVALTSLEHINAPRDRQASMATFITSTNSNNIFKQKQQKYSLDNLKIPRRWMSLRNVISVLNVVVLAIAILVVALVSFYAGTKSTRLAIQNMSNTTINNLMLKLDGTFGAAEKINTFTESIYSTPEYKIQLTVKGLKHLYFIMTAGNRDYDMIYIAAPSSYFVGVALDGDSDSTVLIKYMNQTVRPNRAIVQFTSNCVYNETSCYSSVFDSQTKPISLNLYRVTTRPYYQHAVSTARPGWSSLYLYSDNITYGITAVRPVYYQNALQFVSSVDISLKTLSDYLLSAAISLTGDTQQSPLFFVIEAGTGLLVATSSDDIQNIDQYGNRIVGRNSSVFQIARASSILGDMYPNYSEIEWPSSGGPIVFDDDNAHIIAGQYLRAYGDIDWIVFAYIPYSLYNGQLEQAHYYEIPLVAMLVFIVSICVSVVITRAIGLPLKKIALEMLHVADLNFEEVQEADEYVLLGKDNGFKNAIRQLMRKGRFDINLKEVQYLKSAMSAMRSGLKSFSKYVPLDVVTLLVKMKREAVLGVDEMEISVLFSDIVNFTTISERMDPQDLVVIMRDYLSAMSDIVIDNSGVVDKYIGDSIMAFWNAPISVRDHPTVCCSVALKQQQKLNELRQDWKARGYPDMKVRIGINTGKALVGNLGSSTRLNYTCLGDNVNLASRLESLNKRYGTGIMISEYTWNRCHRDMFVARPLDIVVVKGKMVPVLVYELVGFRKQMRQNQVDAYDLYGQAFEFYRDGKFQEAYDKFQQFQNQMSFDVPVIAKIEECKRRLGAYQSSDPQVWNPIVQITEK